MMKRIAFFVAVACAGLVSSAVQASVAVPMSIEELYSSSDTVVYGEVVEKRTDAYENKMYTINTIQVNQSFKGGAQKSGTVDVITIGGQMGPFGAVSPGAATLSQDEEVILFLAQPIAEDEMAKSVTFDRESPFNTTPFIMGGFQGKFKVVSSEIEYDAGEKTISKERLSVVRPTPGKAMLDESTPTLEGFLFALSSLESRVAAKSVKTRTKTIATVGEVEVVEEQPDLTQLRHFDPLHRTVAKQLSEKRKAEATQAADEQPNAEEAKD